MSYYPPGMEPQPPEAMPREDPLLNPLADPEPPHAPHGKGLVGSITIFFFVVGIAFFSRGYIFRIRHLEVQGVRRVPWQQVAIAAGLSADSHYFSLDENRIRTGINSHRYLIYQGMQKTFPNQLTIQVYERTPVACIQYIGIAYIMAEDGMILEKTRDLSQAGVLINISGMTLRDIREGMFPVSAREGQLDACVALIAELNMQGYLLQVRDINVAEPQNIYITTRDGYSVHLGEQKDYRAKIGTVRAVIAKLQQQGINGGIIEATVPGVATYRPGAV